LGFHSIEYWGNLGGKMITIYTSENYESLKHYYETSSHYNVLWFPESLCHPSEEAKKICSFIEQYKYGPHCEIYTLRGTSINIVSHMIMDGTISNRDVKIILLPDGTECSFNDEGYMTSNWPYGFYSWSYVERSNI
jgi:hypothetical protein